MPAKKGDRNVKCFCNKCYSDTIHNVVANYVIETEGMILHGQDLRRTHDHMIVECRGCGEIHYLRVSIGLEDLIWTMGYDHPWDCSLLQTNYPPRNIARRKPDWLQQLDPETADILSQTYDALHIGADRLVTMGTRAVLEHVVVKHVGDQGSFEANVEEFVKQGYMPSKLKKTVLDTLDVGSAATHRGYKPELEVISTVFEIVESIVHSTCILPAIGKDLSKKTPKRKRKPKKK